MDKALITGATGFLGRYVVERLKNDYQIFTLGRKKTDDGVFIYGDFGDPEINLAGHAFELVVHISGKAHVVPKTDAEARDFYTINHLGTEKLLQALSQQTKLPKALVFISTVAVYGKEKGMGFDETTPLEATDPYGHSKMLAEEAVSSWGAKNGVTITILRLPLIVGSRPPGNLGAMMNAISKGLYFNIGGGKARRSMVAAADVAAIIPMAAKVGGTYNLTDGNHPSFHDTAQCMAKNIGKSSVLSMPDWLAQILAFKLQILEKMSGKRMPFNQNTYKKMTDSLTFSDEKARNKLGWNPSPALAHLKD